MIKINTLRECEDVKDYYFIDEHGKVFSNLKGELKELKQFKKTGGYMNVSLMTNTKTTCDGHKWFRVHRLVALAYVPNDDIENKIYINHKNEIRDCNEYTNLEWVTPKGNNLYSLSKKLYVYDKQGNLYKTYSYTKDCEEDGFNQGHACSCARGEERTHKGYIFSYEELSQTDVAQRLSKTFYIKGKRYKHLYKRSE